MGGPELRAVGGVDLRMPAEWEAQEWLWIGFPHAQDLWEDDLLPAQEEVAAFANAVAESGQDVRLVVRDAGNEARARQLVSGAVGLERHPYGDIWLRDTGPLGVIGPQGERAMRRFGFNGWGGKYRMEGDEQTGASLAAAAGLTAPLADWILEGGAIDTDGTGLAVTTEQCLLNPNRNPGLSQGEIERCLARDLGIKKVVWLGEGLRGDHTDGHVDNLARFVAPGVLAIPEPAGAHDPNAAVYADARARALAEGLEVRAIPSPGRLERGGEPVPASFMNFVICNNLVVVPTYGTAQDEAAVAALGDLFPGRIALALRADAVLTGGGAFHCCSQHVPRAPSGTA